jgi:hypothetical protein
MLGIGRPFRPALADGRPWLSLSTRLWTPSVSIEEDPVIAAATNLTAAIPRLAASAA